MSYEKYIADYRNYLEKWQAVKLRNESGDYSCGSATHGFNCDKIILFDNSEQKAAFNDAYGF